MSRRKNINAGAVVFVLSGILALAQDKPGIKQDSKNSPCSNIVALVGSANVNCSSLTSAQAKIIANIPSLLAKIIANQIDTDVVMQKLDELLRAVSDRVITDADAQRMVASLRPFKDQMAFFAVSGDNDADRLAQRLQTVLRAAGWSVPNDSMEHSIRFGGGPYAGIEIATGSRTPGATRLAQVLNSVFPGAVSADFSFAMAGTSIQITVFPKR